MEYKMSRLDGWCKVVDALDASMTLMLARRNWNGWIFVSRARITWQNCEWRSRAKVSANQSQLRGSTSPYWSFWMHNPLQSASTMYLVIFWILFSNFAPFSYICWFFLQANTTTDQSRETSFPAPFTVDERQRRTTPVTMSTPPISPTPSSSSTASITKQMSWQVLSSVLSSLDRADKHTTFGEFVASELRSLPPHESDALRMAVMRTVVTFLENRQPAVPQPFILVHEEVRRSKQAKRICSANATSANDSSRCRC